MPAFHASAAAAAEEAARDWLETQARVVGYWREMLLAADAEPSLVEALDAHAAFLERAAHAPGAGCALQARR